MLKLIIGVKGTGKTKTLIELVNNAAAVTDGKVVCIEKGTGLRFDLKYSVRLVNTSEYFINNAQSLYGFIAGMLSSNHDITDVFVDSGLKIADNNIEEFEKSLAQLEELSSVLNVNIVMTSSIPADKSSEIINKYV